MILSQLYKFGSPKSFYQFATRFYPWILWGGVLILLFGITWGLLFAPKDYQQGNSFRIIYLHVPSAILAQSCYIFMALVAVISLVWKIKLADMFIAAVAPLGATFTFLALFTGAVWGKPTWGTWWVWDARLTAMLVLLFLYFGVISLRSALENYDLASRASAILVLVGIVNIPIIKYSVEWWNTLHQPATFTLTEKPAMPSEMWIPLLVVMIGMYGLFAAICLMRIKNEILKRERRTKWVQALIAEEESNGF